MTTQRQDVAWELSMLIAEANQCLMTVLMTGRLNKQGLASEQKELQERLRRLNGLLTRLGV